MCNCAKPHPSQVKATIVETIGVVSVSVVPYFTVVSESVNCSCRDGTNTLIMRVYTKQ